MKTINYFDSLKSFQKYLLCVSKYIPDAYVNSFKFTVQHLDDPCALLYYLNHMPHSKLMSFLRLLDIFGIVIDFDNELILFTSKYI